MFHDVLSLCRSAGFVVFLSACAQDVHKIAWIPAHAMVLCKLGLDGMYAHTVMPRGAHAVLIDGTPDARDHLHPLAWLRIYPQTNPLGADCTLAGAITCPVTMRNGT